MKTKHKYDEKLENFLMYLDEDELYKWFETNTIDWSET